MPVLKRQSDKVAVLGDIPLFADLSKRDLAQIARHVSEVEFVPGDHLMVEGESGAEAYVILEGTASVRRKGKKIAVLGRGDVVGEMSLITDLPRNAAVRADTFLPALRIGRKDLDPIMHEFPAVAVKLLRTVAGRLVEGVVSY